MAPASLKRKLLAFDTRTKKAPARKKAPASRRKATKRTTTVNSRKATKRTTTVNSANNKSSAVKREANPPVAFKAERINIYEFDHEDDDNNKANVTVKVKQQKLKPKVEYSPNAMAKCQGCKKKIQKQHKRFGIPEYCARYDKEIYRYYHVKCCPNRYKNLIPDAVEQLAQQKQLVKDKERIVEQRQGLFQELKRCRLLFANRLEVPLFLVFSNEVLKELVVKLPTTSTELLAIHGIGPNKLKSFGDPIMSLIRQYKQQQQQQQGSAAMDQRKPAAVARRVRVKSEISTKSESQSRRKKAPPAPPAACAKVIAIDVDDDDDDDNGGDEIVMGASLTCEQLVNMKFAHAEQNGYVISVD